MTGAAQWRWAAANYLVWCLGCLFLFDAVWIVVAILVYPTGYSPYIHAIKIGGGLGTIAIVMTIALRCRIRLWMAGPAWALGFVVLWAFNSLLLHTIPLFEPSVAHFVTEFRFVAHLLAGSVLLLINHWSVGRHRARAETAVTAAVFD